jgi:hypothetical protein
MSAPQTPDPHGAAPTTRYGKYVALVALLVVVLISVNTLVSRHVGSAGVAPGARLPPFAVPLAASSLDVDADVATGPNEGALGRRPACSVRGAQILNICELYERGPVMLALVTTDGGCTRVLDTIARVLPQFRGVQAAAVSLRGSRTRLRGLIATHRWPFPVGYDRDGALVGRYSDIVCPQLTFAYPGGIAQGHALLGAPTAAALSERMSLLVSQSRARGWRGSA